MHNAYLKFFHDSHGEHFNVLSYRNLMKEIYNELEPRKLLKYTMKILLNITGYFL